jgi:hypothetical protein
MQFDITAIDGGRPIRECGVKKNVIGAAIFSVVRTNGAQKIKDITELLVRKI